VEHRVRVDLAGLTVALPLVAGCDGDDADDQSPVGGGTTPPTSSLETAVTLDEAQDIAMEAVGGGQVLEAEIGDIDDVVRVWEVTVVTQRGERREVSVDVTNGSVVGNVLDD
jgi:uncharacterized membrane protein YkoI